MSATPPPSVPAGWYADPSASGGQRWWDGTAWGPQTAPPPRPLQPPGQVATSTLPPPAPYTQFGPQGVAVDVDGRQAAAARKAVTHVLVGRDRCELHLEGDDLVADALHDQVHLVAPVAIPEVVDPSLSPLRRDLDLERDQRLEERTEHRAMVDRDRALLARHQGTGIEVQQPGRERRVRELVLCGLTEP